MPNLVWRCNVCERDFPSMDAASDCELAHALVQTMVVVDAVFDVEPKKLTVLRFPTRISLQFSDKKLDVADYSLLSHRLRSIS